jgi:hypothetical protein
MDSKENGSYRCHQSCKALAEEQWFGYGWWPAPYWFAGMEPSGKDDARVYETWHQLGAPEIKGGVGSFSDTPRARSYRRLENIRRDVEDLEDD